MADFADLERLIGRPQYDSPPVDWVAVEDAVDLSFPQDYKRIFSIYPRLEFDNFLGIFHPGVDVNLFLQGTNRALDSIRELTVGGNPIRLLNDHGESELVEPFPVFPSKDGLFCWGGTQNGHSCLWLTVGSNPERWPIVIANHPYYWRYEGTVVDFLVGVMDHTVRCPIFPDSFPLSSRVDQFPAD